VKKEAKMQYILLPILTVGILLFSACGASVTTITPPPETITITPPPETITITPPPETITITPPPETITITPPPETITITPPPLETSIQVIESLSPQEAFALIQQNQDNSDFVIIDVRTLEEIAEGYIEGAIFINFYSDTFRDELDSLDKDKVYLIYCRGGGRSELTLLIIEELGFMEAYDILGGFTAWKDAGLPIIGQEQSPGQSPPDMM
jgi:rhodanese-related sulfurtransferase